MELNLQAALEQYLIIDSHMHLGHAPPLNLPGDMDARVVDSLKTLGVTRAFCGQHAGLFAVEPRASQLRATQPLITDDSVDVVVSNCVINLVHTDQRQILCLPESAVLHALYLTRLHFPLEQLEEVDDG